MTCFVFYWPQHNQPWAHTRQSESGHWRWQSFLRGPLSDLREGQCKAGMNALQHSSTANLVVSKPAVLSMNSKTALHVELMWALFLPGSALNNVESTCVC